jgi:hypothetical protein
MLRIAEGGDPDKKFALKILSWIFYTADTPMSLRMEELQSLLVTEKGDRDLQDGELSLSAYIITVCQSLVVLDKNSGVVSFTHFSVYEFLQKYPERLPISEMAKICLTYLSFDEFEKGHSLDLDTFAARWRRFKAGYYVAKSWVLYARKAQASPDVRDLVLEFLASQRKVESMWQTTNVRSSRSRSLNGETVLHLLAENGLATICSYVLVGRQTGIDKYVPCSPFDA